MTAWSEHRYVVVDVEGNGHQPPDLVELAVVPIERGVIGEPATWLFQPEQPITPMARRIHGITDDNVHFAHALSLIRAMPAKRAPSTMICSGTSPA